MSQKVRCDVYSWQFCSGMLLFGTFPAESLVQQACSFGGETCAICINLHVCVKEESHGQETEADGDGGGLGLIKCSLECVHVPSHPP